MWASFGQRPLITMVRAEDRQNRIGARGVREEREVCQITSRLGHVSPKFAKVMHKSCGTHAGYAIKKLVPSPDRARNVPVWHAAKMLRCLPHEMVAPSAATVVALMHWSTK